MSSDRRDFLKFLLGGTALGIASSPLQTIIEAAIFESAKRAHAQQINYNPERFYFNLSFPGAPPRWNYDLFLDPYSANGNNVVPNASVATRFGGSGSRYDKAIYQTFKVPGYNIHAPWIWGQQMPTSSGGFVPIHKLMEHMLVIQGINTEAPGHDESRLRMEQANGYTVSGFLSDSIKSSFNSVDLDSAYPFSSKTGLSITSTGLSATANLVQTLMSKFDSSSLTINKSLNGNLKAAYLNALDNLNYDSSVRTPAALNIKKTHEGALELINSSIGNLATIWNDKYAKYRGLADTAFTDRARFVGFMDKPVGLEDLTKRNRDYQVADNQLNYIPDLRDMSQANMIGTLAPVFAVAEFLAENKLATSLQSRINAMAIRRTLTAGGTIASAGLTHDQHNVGVMMATMSNGLMYRALSTCLYEFITTLKNPSFKGYKFQDTVIRLSGDFNRSPRVNNFNAAKQEVNLNATGTLSGTGSDHGFQGQVATIFSGKIHEPIIAGRIYKDATAAGLAPLGLPALVGNNYMGSWGVGAPVNIEGGSVVLKPGHAISTVATLLGIASPAFNNASLVKVINGKATLIKEDLKLKVVG